MGIYGFYGYMNIAADGGVVWPKASWQDLTRNVAQILSGTVKIHDHNYGFWMFLDTDKL